MTFRGLDTSTQPTDTSGAFMNDEPVGHNKLRPTRGCDAPIIAEISATGTKPRKWAKQRRRNEICHKKEST